MRLSLRSRPLNAGALCAALLCAGGCHSAFVAATVVNHSGGRVQLIELDYPSASFGTDALPAGATFKYRFKILGSGTSKISWTDAHGTDHTSTGPALQEGQEGTLTVSIEPTTATWAEQLRP